MKRGRMLFQQFTNRTEMLMILLLASQSYYLPKVLLAKKQIEENEENKKISKISN
jgi:hypothetical protein